MPQPTIELSMIVCNAAATLHRCLASAAPLVDRIVLGDTGSTDQTLCIARHYQAEIQAIPWENNFAAARNRVLAHARCDWILVLDADEMLDPTEAAAALPALLNDTSVHAYTFHRWNYIRRLENNPVLTPVEPNPGLLPEAQAYPAFLRSFHIRLFRRHPGVFFEPCVHEHLTHRLNALGLKRLTIAQPVIHHFSHVEDMPASARAKTELYYRLGLTKLATHPREFDTHFELGISEMQHLKDPEKALGRFRAAAALRPADGRAPLYGGICLLRLGRIAQARQALLRAQALGEQTSTLYDALGDTYLRMGKHVQALTAYQQAQALGCLSPLLAAKYGATEVQLGQVQQGLARICQAIEQDPQTPILRTLLRVSEESARPTRQRRSNALCSQATQSIWRYPTPPKNRIP